MLRKEFLEGMSMKVGKNVRTIYKAHIKEETGDIQTVKAHSENTAELCKQFAVPALKEFLYTIGLFHDVGKFQESFQKKIDGEMRKVEHSMSGALVAHALYPNAVGLMMEYCIAGHHSGIPDGGFPNDTQDMSTLCGRRKRSFEDVSVYQNELEPPILDQNILLDFFMRDCGRNVELLVDKFAFLTRYSFSCLVP